MLRRLTLAALAAALLVGGLSAGGASGGGRSGAHAAAAAGARYIADRQAATGAFFTPDAPADQTADALVATVAAEVDGGHVARALERLAAAGPARASEKPAYAGRIVLGLLAAGADPRAFAGTDFVAAAGRGYNPATGAYDSNLYANALALLGAAAAGAPVPEAALTYIGANRCPSGGWSWQEGCLSGRAEVDTTAMTIVALRTAGIATSDPLLAGARSWLASAQHKGGGFGIAAGDEPNANSTGLVLSAITHLRENASDSPWLAAGRSPVEVLAGLQEPSGAFRYTSATAASDYATVQAVAGMSGRVHPVRPATQPAPGGAPVLRRTVEARTVKAAAAAAPAESSPEPDAPAAGPGGDTGTAAVYVDDGSGAVQRFCPLVEDDSTSGIDILEHTGVELIVSTSSLGTSVCKIGPHGCGSDNCFCAFPTFWRYYTRAPGGEWTFSEAGASDRTVTPGDADAWIFGDDESPPPPASETHETICATAAEQRLESTDEGDPATEPDAGEETEGAGAFSPGILLTVGLVVIVAAIVLVTSRRRNGEDDSGSAHH